MTAAEKLSVMSWYKIYWITPDNQLCYGYFEQEGDVFELYRLTPTGIYGCNYCPLRFWRRSDVIFIGVLAL